MAADKLAMTGKSVAPADAPECASCHAYPPADLRHMFHLYGPNANTHVLEIPQLNGLVTCMDCHFTSIRHFSYGHQDTIWVDATGKESRIRLNPTYRMLRIETFQLFRPLNSRASNPAQGEALAIAIDSQMFRSNRKGELMQWITDRTHNNGKLEVSFPPNAVTHPESLATAFRPRDASCSAVACHSVPGRYRWLNPEKGLSGCPSLGDTTCLEPAP